MDFKEELVKINVMEMSVAMKLADNRRELTQLTKDWLSQEKGNAFYKETARLQLLHADILNLQYSLKEFLKPQ